MFSPETNSFIRAYLEFDGLWEKLRQPSLPFWGRRKSHAPSVGVGRTPCNETSDMIRFSTTRANG